MGPQAKALQSLYDAARKGGEDKVVIYAGLYTPMKPVFDAFSKRFPGIKVTGKDSYGAPMETSIGQEVVSKPAQRADIAHTANTTMLHLADKGLLQSYSPPAATGVKGESLVYKDHLLTAADYIFFGNLVNTDVVKKTPTSWEALLDPSLKGKVTIQDPTKAGGGNGILTILGDDPRYGFQYSEKLKANGAVSSPTYPEEINKVVDGTYGVGIFIGYSNYLAVKKDGAPVKFVFPVQKGVWLPEEYFGLVKNAPHPDAAKLLINYFYTPEGQQQLANIGEISPMPNAPAPEGVPGLSKIPRLKSIPLSQVLQRQQYYTAKLEKLFS